MVLYIKNMVCPRCIAAVNNILKSIDADIIQVNLGEVILANDLTESRLHELGIKLHELGFELLDDNRKQQIEKIKSIIIKHIHHSEEGAIKQNFSEILASELHKEYSQLSKLFSSTEGITIEQFIILQKIEKVKELLAYNEDSLSEIAFRLGYSSVAHLSSQFKKITGLTPSQFKLQGIRLRKSLDNI